MTCSDSVAYPAQLLEVLGLAVLAGVLVQQPVKQGCFSPEVLPHDGALQLREGQSQTQHVLHPSQYVQNDIQLFWHVWLHDGSPAIRCIQQEGMPSAGI